MNDYRAYVMCDYCSIYHFGTDGMKWGKRRYQNEDGSYKSGAEGRYYDPVGKEKRPSSKKDASKERVKSEEPVKTKKTGSSKKESEHKVRHFISSHKGEIAIGAAAAASIIAGVALYKVSTRKKTNVVKDISDTVKRIDIPKTDIQKATVDKANPFKVSPNSTKAAAEAAKKAAQNVGQQTRQHTNARTVAKSAENLARATKEHQTEAQKIIDAVDSGSDYVNQLLKENEEMLKKIRGGK